MLKIAEIRKIRGLTQKQLAEKLKIYQSNMSNWENGVTEPDIQSLIIMANILDVTLDELVGRERIEIVNEPLQNGVTPIAKQLLEAFYKLSETDQHKVVGMVQALAVMS